MIILLIILVFLSAIASVLLTFHLAQAQDAYSDEAVSTYGVPEEPLITSATDNQRQAEEGPGGGGGHHHHHHGDNPLDWLRASVPGLLSLPYKIYPSAIFKKQILD